MKPILDLQETCEIFRRNDVPMDQESLKSGIKAGAFPFASLIPCNSHDKPLIYKALFARWLRERGMDINRCSNVVIWEDESA